MNRQISFGFFWCAVFCLSAGSCQVSAAETQRGFSIDPFFQEITIGGNQASTSFSIEVRNTTDAPVTLHASVLDFGTLDESGGVAFLGASDNLKYSLASWVKLADDTVTLGSGGSKKVEGTIENSGSLSPGGHYGAVFFKIDDGGGGNGQELVKFNPSFASLLFVRKTGGEIYGLGLDQIDFPTSIVRLPDTVRLRFQNTGNVYVTPRGIVELIDPFGRPVEKSIINNESGIVLPEASRIFSSLFIPLAARLIPGRYMLSVEYRFDGKDDFAIEQRTFLYIPLPSIAIVAGLIGLFVAYRFVKKKVRR